MRGGVVGMGVGIGVPSGGGAVPGNIGAGIAPGAMNGSGCAIRGPSRPAGPGLPQQQGSQHGPGAHLGNQQQPDNINKLPDKASIAQRMRRMEVTLCSGRGPCRKRSGHMVYQDLNGRCPCPPIMRQDAPRSKSARWKKTGWPRKRED